MEISNWTPIQDPCPFTKRIIKSIPVKRPLDIVDQQPLKRQKVEKTDSKNNSPVRKKVEKTDITLSKAFAECEVLGETARGKMVTDVLSEVDDYWKNRNIVVDKCMRSKGFELK